jgi:sensor histidine kinase YesM
MRKRLAWVRDVPFRKLQLRVMVYLLLFGSIPIICAMVTFYYQSSEYSREELEQFVDQSHDLMVDQFEREFDLVEKKAESINADAEVQRMLNTTVSQLDTGEGEFLAYLYRIIPLWKSESLRNTEICFSFYISNTSICGDSRYIQLDRPLENRNDIRMDRNNDELQRFRYIVPLYDINTDHVRGHLVMIFDPYSIFANFNEEQHRIEHMVLDSDGKVAFGSMVSLHPDYTVSEHSFNVFNERWISIIRVKNDGFSKLKDKLGSTAIMFLLLLLILSLSGSLIFSRILTKPLQYLRSLMKRAELGDLKAYWTYKSSQDIDELGDSYNQMLNRLEDVIKQVKVEESLKKEKEFEALQYQLNPHFLYNTLNTIKWVAKIHKTPQISEVVSALVRLLQVSLNKKGDFITVREEVGLVKDYMDIQTFRYGEDIEVETIIESVAAQCLVPKMILQPLVENALIHGLDQSGKQDKRIIIRVWIERDLLFCQVEDNGKGLDDEQLLLLDSKSNKRDGVKERLSGIGLKHIREKIRLYYGPDYYMHIISKPNQGTTIRLTLPIHQSEG